MRNITKCLLSLIIVSLFCIIMITPAVAAVEKPTAINGSLDLISWDFKRDKTISLDGDWEFYWNELLTMEDFNSDSYNKEFITVPSPWNEKVIDDKKLGSDGFATYRLKVKTNGNQKDFAIRCKTISTAYSLYVDDNMITSGGKVGTDEKSSEPEYNSGVFVFHTDKAEFNIILHVSNYSFDKGGIWESLSIGNPDALTASREKDIAVELFTIGALIIISLYYLSFFIFRKKDKEMLYFGLACLIIGFRSSLVGTGIFSKLFPIMSWGLERRLEFICLYLAAAALVLFFKKVYPQEIHKLQVTITLIVSGAFTLQVIILPLKIFAKTNVIFLLFTVILFILIIGQLILAKIRHRSGAGLSLFGIATFTFTGINDILNSSQIIYTTNLISFGLLAFVLTQAVILSMRISNAFYEIEKLSVTSERAKLRIEKTLKTVSSTGSSINGLVEALNIKTENLIGISNDIKESMTANTQSIESEKNSIHGSVQSLNKLKKDITEVSDKSTVMSSLAMNANEVSSGQVEKMKEMQFQIETIKDIVLNLSQLMEVVQNNSAKSVLMLEAIKKIADSTRMLSLNASVEAAKANEYGKGFLIIASEIRKLSDESNKLAKIINDNINGIQSSIKVAFDKTHECVAMTARGVDIANEAYNSFEIIKSSVKTIYQESQNVQQCSKNADDMASFVLDEFSNMVTMVDQTYSSVMGVYDSTQIEDQLIKKAKQDLNSIIEQVEILNNELQG